MDVVLINLLLVNSSRPGADLGKCNSVDVTKHSGHVAGESAEKRNSVSRRQRPADKWTTWTFSTYSYTPSLPSSLPPFSLTHSPTHSLIQPPTRALTHPPSHSPPSFLHFLPLSLRHLLPPSLTQSLPYFLPPFLTHPCFPHSIVSFLFPFLSSLPGSITHNLPLSLPASSPHLLLHSLPSCLSSILPIFLPPFLPPSLPHSLTHSLIRPPTHSRDCLSSFVLQKKPENINGSFLGYKIKYKKTNESNSYQKTLRGPATSHELSSLAEATEYDVRVLVYNDKGNGPASNVTTVRTLVRKGENEGEPPSKDGGQL